MIHSETDSILKAVTCLKAGELIAYPTEAVYGLGCDPFNETAVKTLLHVKQRPLDKGVILVAATLEQITPYVSLVDTPWAERVLASWPGPVTWVLPVKSPLPEWITGGRETVAVRLSSHPTVQALCRAFGGPIVSTSANVSQQPPAMCCEAIKEVFEASIYCVAGTLGELLQPTEIRLATTGAILRH